MNKKELIPKPFYNFKRLWAKCCIVLAEQSLMMPKMRFKLLKMGGVKLKGYSFIGSHVKFDGIYPNLIEIGEGCVITSGTHILSHFFNTHDRRFYSGKVIIGKRVFIGLNTLIINSVSIGDNAIIGAGSVINKDIPANELWAGNPAKFIKKI